MGFSYSLRWEIFFKAIDLKRRQRNTISEWYPAWEHSTTSCFQCSLIPCLIAKRKKTKQSTSGMYNCSNVIITCVWPCLEVKTIIYVHNMIYVVLKNRGKISILSVCSICISNTIICPLQPKINRHIATSIQTQNVKPVIFTYFCGN